MSTPLRQSDINFSRLFLLLACISLLLSCSHSRNEAKQQQELPAPLKDEGNEIRLLSKRGSGDYLQNIYHDLVEKTPELQQLEKNVNQLNETIGDSTQTFENFDEKNKVYYSSTDIHLRSISDSVLRENIKTLVANSMKNYNSSISKHKELLASLQQKNVTLDDLHEVLKIMKTLSVIQQYQKDLLPSTKPLAGINQETDKVIKQLQTATKK